MANVLTVDLDKTLNLTGEYIPLAAILAVIMEGCDGARNRDGTGFNRDDLSRGAHHFVEYLATSPQRLKMSNLLWGLGMAVFYQRQWINHFPENTLPQIKLLQKYLRQVVKEAQ